MSVEALQTGSEANDPSASWQQVCKEFERVYGVKSPFKSGETIEQYLMMKGDPLRYYQEKGFAEEFSGFATAMAGEELPERPLLRGKIAQIAAKVSEAGKRALRWEGAKRGFDSYSTQTISYE